MLLAQLPGVEINPLEAGKAIASVDWTFAAILVLVLVGCFVLAYLAIKNIAPKVVEVIKDWLAAQTAATEKSFTIQQETFKATLARQEKQASEEIKRLVAQIEGEKAFRETTLANQTQAMERSLKAVTDAVLGAVAGLKEELRKTRMHEQ